MIINKAMLKRSVMKKLQATHGRPEIDVATVFAAAGWRVEVGPTPDGDLLLTSGIVRYIAEVKSASEGRPDRVIALLSQALLEATAYARELPGTRPLAVVWTPEASQSLIDKVDVFRRRFAPDAAVGVVSGTGVRHFAGRGLEELSARPSSVQDFPRRGARQAHNLFSDLNQWMLKVLLAPEVPERLLSAPRGNFRNVSELASAAGVSIMSAFRFVTRLREEGFLDQAGSHLHLVRRSELFRRWRAAALHSTPERNMRFLLPGATPDRLQTLLSGHAACLGLFAAADRLGLGHVAGVPPYVYVRNISDPEKQARKEVVPATRGE
jgi:hypothetical protein